MPPWRVWVAMMTCHSEMSHNPYTPEMKAAVAAWFQEEQQQLDRKEALEPMEGFTSNYDAVLDSMSHRIEQRFPDACEDSLRGEVYRFLQPS
jgi:hypothetical protein